MNSPAPVLDQVLIGYSPVFDRTQQCVATRLTVFPARADAPPDGAALLAAVTEAFADAPQQATRLPAVLLNIADEALLDSVLAAAQIAPCPLLIEVPGFMAATRATGLQGLRTAGQALAVGGWPLPADASALVPVFRYAMLDTARLLAAGGPPAGLPASGWVCTGIRQTAEAEAALAAGATALAGWSVDDELVPAMPAGVPPEVRGIVELMNRVERSEPPDRLEAVLTGDPTLAFRLLRYLNSSAFGLRAEVTSFRHGLMMLGHQRLKRWLALLLATGSSNPGSRPLMAVAARRGLILEELGRASGDETLRSDMFICGVFSLLDRLLRQPMPLLMRGVPVPERVAQSLLGPGPYASHLALVRALEQAAAVDIRGAAEVALIARAEVNRALLRALSLARDLD